MCGRTLPLTKALLAAIVLIYCLVGLAYAVETPRWQTPDEPAHYNYIVHLVQNRRFPVLQMGDYPHEYLEQIKAAGFPPDMAVESIRYESHQPPLYYVLAAFVHETAAPLGLDFQLLALRMLSVFLGAALLVVAFCVVREVFPENILLALTTTAMIATVPMHVAMSAAINNDTLAELILALVIWLSVKEIRTGLSQRQTVALGLLVALALLTKTTIYAPVLVSSLLVLAVRGRGRGRWSFLRSLGIVYGLGVLLSGWWFLRNVIIYGALDLFAWQRHDSVVVGQPTTAGWIADYGLAKTVHDFVSVSFRSFWAQFGWMGVLIDSRLYLMLAVVSAVAAVGFLLWLWRVACSPASLVSFQRWSLLLLLLVFLLVATAHASYNLKFVQHQGRYLFPALLPIGLSFALGLLEWSRRAAEAASRLLPPGRLELVLPSALRWAAFSVFYAGFLALDLVCLYLFVVPQLRA